MENEIIVEKVSDTEVKITQPVPTQSVGDVRSKTEIINRISWLDGEIANAQAILADRIATFQGEKDQLNVILTQADAQGVKTDEEVIAEAPVDVSPAETPVEVPVDVPQA